MATGARTRHFQTAPGLAREMSRPANRHGKARNGPAKAVTSACHEKYGPPARRSARRRLCRDERCQHGAPWTRRQTPRRGGRCKPFAAGGRVTDRTRAVEQRAMDEMTHRLSIEPHRRTVSSAGRRWLRRPTNSGAANRPTDESAALPVCSHFSGMGQSRAVPSSRRLPTSCTRASAAVRVAAIQRRWRT